MDLMKYQLDKGSFPLYILNFNLVEVTTTYLYKFSFRSLLPSPPIFTQSKCYKRSGSYNNPLTAFFKITVFRLRQFYL